MISNAGPYSTTRPGRGPDVARRLVRVVRGPLATVYACPFCDHRETLRHTRHGFGLGGGVGRGYGLRVGGAMHSRTGAHIRAAHAVEVEAARAAGAAK